MTETLFTPFAIGDIDVKNRIVMAPLTRNRARAEDDTPFEIHAEYYAQRAGAGLIITEGTQISPEGKGYAWTPGIHSAAQVAGWRKVTDAVHAKGGRIAAQLWHVGRISHTSLQAGGAAEPFEHPLRPQRHRAFVEERGQRRGPGGPVGDRCRLQDLRRHGVCRDLGAPRA